jgi:hypothetical protein
MDPEIKEYFKRIINTISFGLLWMAINSTAGIMYDHAFIHGRLQWHNIIFYIWFSLSLAAYLWYVIKIWKKPLNIPE